MSKNVRYGKMGKILNSAGLAKFDIRNRNRSTRSFADAFIKRFADVTLRIFLHNLRFDME